MSETTACSACRERDKTWNGDEPQCAFPDGDLFDSANWCCATVSLLRNLDNCGSPRMHMLWDDDDNYMSILLGGLTLVTMPEGDPIAVMAKWYKRRGRTDSILVCYSDIAPMRVSEDQLLEVIQLLTEEER